MNKEIQNNVLGLVAIFVAGFLLNWVWEHLHHVLYMHYKGGEITDFILFRAALFDASFITVVFGPFLLMQKLRRYAWVPILVALGFAIGLEVYAIQTGRWAYRATMPLVPLLGTGITPTVQLATLGYIAFATTRRWVLV